MKPAVLALALTALIFAQQPTIENAKLETRVFSGSLAAELSRPGAGPFWLAWSEPIIAGQHSEMCSWNNNWNNPGDYGRSGAAPVRLEGQTALVVLIRMETGRVDQLRVTSPDCRLDAGGLPFHWLTGVPADESVTWLKSQASGTRGETATMAISLHAGPTADRALEDLTALTEPVEVRKRAAFWLGTSRGTPGVAVLKRMLAADPSPDVRDRVVFGLSRSADPQGLVLVIDAARHDSDAHVRGQALFWLAQKAAANVSKDAIGSAIANDPETAVRERAVFALTQLPNGDGIPMLIELAKTHRDPAVKKKAMFWLGQSKDPRALDFFAQVLK